MKNLHQRREISTLSFNERVLQEAEDTRNPLMERLKFLGIFSSNMDEFFKVRVASIHRRIELGRKSMQEVLEVIGVKARELDERFRVAYAGITADLAEQGVRILTEEDLAAQPPDVRQWVEEYYQEEISPSLVPIILSKNQSFPQLRDGFLYLGIVMHGQRTKRYALLEMPEKRPRFVELPNGNIMYADDVIRHSLGEIFYIFDFEGIEAYEFKVSRDAELDIDNDFSEGYIRKMERVLEQRKGGRPTRFVYDANIHPGLRRVLMEGLNISKYDTLIPGGRYHNMKDLMRFPNHRPDLSFPEMEPAEHPVFDQAQRPMMELIDEQDVFVTYPYQDFDHVVRLLREAAIDPRVTTIKMCLYRVAKRSQVVNALYNAARNGKKIFVSIELQARFDEENNIHIAEVLSEVGATVTFGVPPMKVHGKIFLIERKGKNIAGLSTGNLNEKTARLYVDSMLLTADKRLTEEVNKVFNYLQQAAQVRAVTAPEFKHLIVSPFNSRRTFMRLIDRELKKGADGYIFFKVNHLTDNKIIRKLRQAADAGVRMDFVVRTTYALLPHENVRAISILDRYLEHQRIYIFGKGEDRRIYVSSADMMERNIDWRVEVSFPIYDPAIQKELQDIMAPQVADTYKARILDETQSNHYVGENRDGRRAQWETYRYYQRVSERAVEDTEPAEAARIAL